MLNKSLAVFLVDESVRAIKVAFGTAGKFYTYKTTDKSIKVGDFVLVNTQRGYSVVEVKYVDIQNTLDFEDTSIEYTWIVQKLDLTDYQEKMKREVQLQESINHLVFQGKKQQMLEVLKKSNVDLKQLTF